MILRISECLFEITGVSEDLLSDNVRIFHFNECSYVNNNIEVDFHYNFYFVKQFPSLQDNFDKIYKSPDLEVYNNSISNREARKLYLAENIPYALCVETSEVQTNVYFNTNLSKWLKSESVFMSCLMPERKLALKDIFILHTCYLFYKKAILYSGPSGIGKSTQGNLFCEFYKNSRMINGDRCLLYFTKEGILNASGWPVSGSSGVCNNETNEVGCIAFITHDKEVSIKHNDCLSLYKRLLTQITYNRWNKDQSNLALSFVQKVLETSIVVDFHCNLSYDSPQMINNFINCKL